MSDKNRIKELLEKLNRGSEAPEDLVELRDIFKNQRFRVEEILEEDWKAAGEKSNAEKAAFHDARWQRVEKMIFTNAPRYKRRKVFKLVATAAAVISTLVAVWWIIAPDPEIQTSGYIVAENVSIRPMSLELPDGSHIILDRNSQLRYPKQFAEKHRDVHLSGKAYFRIAEDHSRPFTVFTGHLSTTVLGTSFVVDANKDSDSLNVSLFTGKVVIRPEEGNTKKEWFLEPRQALTAYASGKSTKMYSFRTKYALEWTREEFDFKNRSLIEVLELLEADREIEFEYKREAVDRCKITGTFGRFQDLDQILRLIFFSIDLDYKRVDENRFEIFGQGCME